MQNVSGYFYALFAFLLISTNGHNIDTRIVNGSNSLPGQYPYVVSLRYFDKHECGASIIGEKWILTAAHCIYQNFVNESTILFGSTFVQDGQRPAEHTRGAKRAIVHENYTAVEGYENDIALLELVAPIPFSDVAKPIPLPTQGKETPSGSKAILVGWGYSRDEGFVMPVLQQVELFVYSDKSCLRMNKNITNPKVHICAGVVAGGKGQCSGDSGGPLTVNGTQYGVVSWSDRPCSSNVGVLAKVSTYRTWIYQHTGI